MKCSNCKLWKWDLDRGGKKDLRRQYKIFGKALGSCTYNGNFYPTWNYEKCPFIKGGIK